MKLKNKKTGEIGKKLKQLSEDNQLEVITDNKLYVVKTLAELNSEWEDYEEPREYWYIRDHKSSVGYSPYDDNVITKYRKEIGNYFETKEEAEKAVEKLKAIKILKENGFRFIQWEFDMKTIADGKIWFDVGVNTQWDAEQLLKYRPEVKESLDLLFGGKE